MENKIFLSDKFKNDFEYHTEKKPSFISASEKTNLNNQKFTNVKIEKCQEKFANEYTIKSATASKWSIKFK